MPQYQGQFYGRGQAAGDVLRQIFDGLRVGRQDALQARAFQQDEAEREQRRLDAIDERNYQRGRDARQDAIADETRQQNAGVLAIQRARELADLRARGISEGTAPTDATTTIDLRGLGGVTSAVIPDRKRYTQLGGFYEDRDATPMARVQRAVSKALAGDTQGAVAEGMAPEAALALVNRPGSQGALDTQRKELALQDEFAAKADARRYGFESRIAAQRAASKPVSTVPAFGDVLQFRTQYANDATVKQATEVANSVAIARKAAAGDTGVSDVSLVYAAGKAFDPNSVVREGEFSTLEKSQSVPQRIIGMARRVSAGDRLTPEMRQQLVDAIEDRGEVARQMLAPVRQRFGGIAQSYGMPLDQTVYDPFEQIPARAKQRLTPRDVPGLELPVRKR